MNKQDLQFQIDQLRKDKMIYALEAIATSVTAIFGFFIFGNYFNAYSDYIIIAAYLVVGYWAYCMIGNLFRLIKIRNLEKIIHEKHDTK